MWVLQTYLFFKWYILLIYLFSSFSFFFIWFNLKPLLYFYSAGIECCTLYSFEDSRCYLNLLNGQYLVQVLPVGTHIVHLSHTCYLAAGASHDQHSVHRHGKVHIGNFDLVEFWMCCGALFVILWLLNSPEPHISNQLWNIYFLLDI